MDIFLIIWGLFAVITFNIATNKGLDPVRWAVIGLLLGILGVFLALIWPKDEEEIQLKQLKNGVLIKCPHCKEPIKPDASICKHCKSKIEA